MVCPLSALTSAIWVSFAWRMCFLGLRFDLDLRHNGLRRRAACRRSSALRLRYVCLFDFHCGLHLGRLIGLMVQGSCLRLVSRHSIVALEKFALDDCSDGHAKVSYFCWWLVSTSCCCWDWDSLPSIAWHAWQGAYVGLWFLSDQMVRLRHAHEYNRGVFAWMWKMLIIQRWKKTCVQHLGWDICCVGSPFAWSWLLRLLLWGCSDFLLHDRLAWYCACWGSNT